MSAPAWVALESRSKNVTGASRTARVSKCPRCGSWVVVGLDADMGSVSTICDPTPLSATGEALALLTGRRTLTLSRTGGRLTLERRDDLRISSEPAGTGAYDVVAAHGCEAAPLPSCETSIAPVAADGWGLPNDPPF